MADDVMEKLLEACRKAPDYHDGWFAAQRGEPMPKWPVKNTGDYSRLSRTQIGWEEYHAAMGGQSDAG